MFKYFGQDFCSNISDGKENFFLNILGTAVHYFCLKRFGAKKDFCSNILDAKQDFWSNILDAKQYFCSIICGAQQTFAQTEARV